MSLASGTINSFDDLVAYASAVITKSVEYEPPTFSATSITFTVRVHGEDWSKSVDVRHARYIIALQESVDDIIAEYVEGDSCTQLLVRSEISDGSSDFKTELLDFLQKIVTPMTPESTFISIMTAIVCATGYFVYSRSLDHKIALANMAGSTAALAEHEKTKQAMLGAFAGERAMRESEYASYERPIKLLVSSMSDSDVIFFGDESSASTKDEARNALPRRQRSSEKTTYADGTYTLNAIDYSQWELILLLEQDGVTIKGYTSQLSDEDAARLFEEVHARQLAEDLPLSLVVQINVKHTAKRIKHGSIVGFGRVREEKEHSRLASLLP